MKRYKILFLFSGYNFGGSSISTICFIEKLKKSDYEILVCKEGELTKLLQLKGIEYSFLPSYFRPVKGNFLRKLTTIILSIRNKNFLNLKNNDIIHTNEIDMHLACFLPSFFGNIKHIWHQRTPNKKSVLLSYFSNLITVSEYTKNSFPFIIKSKAKVIYNPFEYFKPRKEEVSKNLKIGFVGNLIKRKNINVFIKIISTLDNNYKGIIFGEKREPIYSDAKKQISNLKIQDKIDFKGLVFPIEKHLPEIDILIAPATDEAFGRNLVEAMMLGIPVLALDYGGHKEIIEDEIDGFLIKNNNIDMYIEKIKLLVDNPDLYQAISKKAHKKARDKFGVDIHVKKMTEFYNEILNK